MYSIEEPITISKESLSNDLDFFSLREIGIEYIEKFGRKLWSDYNLTDSGVTIMELFCYAITDLGLRINQPIDKLLTRPNGTIQTIIEDDNGCLKTEFRQFQTAREILPCKPVTALDYRALFLDVEDVKNIWISPYHLSMHVLCNPDQPKISRIPFNHIEFAETETKVKGLNKLYVLYEENADRVQVEKEIFKIYHKNRNLCEDLVEVIPIESTYIKLCANMQIHNNADEELIMAKIEHLVEEYFNPTIKRYSLEEMLEKYPTEKVFEGPVLKKGFIDYQELEDAQLKKQLRLSDIMNIIMSIDGVDYIESISFEPVKDEDCSGKNPNINSNEWEICLPEYTYPKLCNKSSFTFKKGFLPVGINEEKKNQYLAEIRVIDEKMYNDIALPTNDYLDYSQYTTIKNDLPKNYGVSPYGLPSNADKKRKAQAKQLKGYLLFFDQILSLYFSQLSYAKELLSGNNTLKSYYVQNQIQDFENLEELISNPGKFSKDFIDDVVNQVSDYKKDRNKLFDHLLDRFSETFVDYSTLMYKNFGNEYFEDSLATKSKLINNIGEIGYERGLGFNYTLPDLSSNACEEFGIWNTNNVSGVQKRISLLSGISNFSRRDLLQKVVEIIEEKDNDNCLEYRWRINKDNDILIHGTKRYHNPLDAYNAAVFCINEGTEKKNFKIRKIKNQNTRFFVIEDKNSTSKKKKLIGKSSDYDSLKTIKDEITKAHLYFETLKKSLHVLEEGFYLIENILLLPLERSLFSTSAASWSNLKNIPICIDETCGSCTEPDPYSFQVTIVFPGFTPRFANIDFREFMTQLIAENLPAHIKPRVCWVGDFYNLNKQDNDLKDIQKAWFKFLKSKRSNKYNASIATTNQLQKVINKLNTIYSQGRLFDCHDDEKEQGKKIILNQSSMGSL